MRKILEAYFKDYSEKLVKIRDLESYLERSQQFEAVLGAHINHMQQTRKESKSGCPLRIMASVEESFQYLQPICFKALSPKDQDAFRQALAGKKFLRAPLASPIWDFKAAEGTNVAWTINYLPMVDRLEGQEVRLRITGAFWDENVLGLLVAEDHTLSPMRNVSSHMVCATANNASLSSYVENKMSQSDQAGAFPFESVVFSRDFEMKAIFSVAYRERFVFTPGKPTRGTFKGGRGGGRGRGRGAARGSHHSAAAAASS